MTIAPADARATVIQAFAASTGVPPFTRVLQRGREPATARFSLELTDGRIVHLGTVEALFSPTRFANAILVTTGYVLDQIKAADWRASLNAVVAHCVDVVETPDETLAERVADWLEQYSRGASSDKEGALSQRLPFVDASHLHVSAEHFRRWVGREYQETLTAHEIRTALADNGYHTVTISYDATGRGNTRQRTSTSYYTDRPADPATTPVGGDEG